MKDSIWNKIRYKYWEIWPNNLRPSEIFYTLKCFFWHRYSTVRPRWLGHTWCDRDTLLIFSMFEILTRFVEEECSPGHIDWYHDQGSKIRIEGELVDKYVRDEMDDLLEWWNNEYLPFYNGKLADKIWETMPKPKDVWTPAESGFLSWDLEFKSEEDEEKYDAGMAKLHELDKRFYE